MSDPKSPAAQPEDLDETLVPDSGDESTRRQPDPADPFRTILADHQDQHRDAHSIRYDALVRGDQIGDFLIQRLLGRGGFGAVYLARELSLDRLVAIKVVLPHGQTATAGEGRSLARLKHPNIVGVYGEAHDPTSGCALLWMQYVDGCNLASVITRLDHHSGRNWYEADLLRLINANQDSFHQSSVSAPTRGSIETVCQIGRQLAEAISHAHGCGVTHRDIKPANVLMQGDGTPLLADFNLASNESDRDHAEISGGTIAYMPPEQLARLLRQTDSFDGCRADIYSLGVVLWELAWGSRPHAEAESSLQSRGTERLNEILQLRQASTQLSDAADIGLSQTLGRALAPDPRDRYPSAGSMATALRGLAELQQARNQVQPNVRLGSFVRRHLFWIILIGGVAPHLVASWLQSEYNKIWIGTDASVFTNAFIAYNLVVYPACVGWLAWHLHRFARGYRQVVAKQPVPRSQLRRLRMRLLNLPRRFMIASAIGWFPGILLFPLLLQWFGESPTRGDWYHYSITFAIAGLIATSYSYAVVVYLVVCYGYRICWQTASRYRQRARYELSRIQTRIRKIAILAGVLPLAAAVLLLAVGLPPLHESVPTDQASVIEYVQRVHQHEMQVADLHRLVIELVVFGAAGLFVVATAFERLMRVVRALTLADR